MTFIEPAENFDAIALLDEADKVDLQEINLRLADLSGFDLSDINLRGADLSGAVLIGTKLNGTNLQAADLNGAELHKTDFGFADLLDANLDGAVFDPTTILPDGKKWTRETELRRFTDNTYDGFWAIGNPGVVS
jgi:hypothetical protein